MGTQNWAWKPNNFQYHVTCTQCLEGTCLWPVQNIPLLMHAFQMNAIRRLRGPAENQQQAVARCMPLGPAHMLAGPPLQRSPGLKLSSAVTRGKSATASAAGRLRLTPKPLCALSARIRHLAWAVRLA